MAIKGTLDTPSSVLRKAPEEAITGFTSTVAMHVIDQVKTKTDDRMKHYIFMQGDRHILKGMVNIEAVACRGKCSAR